MFANVAKCWRARSRLYRHRFLQVNMFFTVWYCSQIQLRSFTPPLNSPTPAQRVAVDLSFKQNADRPVWKKFTRKSSKLPRSGCQNIFPPFFFCQSATGKIRTAPSPRRFVPPNAKRTNPLLPISYRIRTDCYRGGAQDLSSETSLLPKSLHLISNQVGGMGPLISWAHWGIYHLPEITTI